MAACTMTRFHGGCLCGAVRYEFVIEANADGQVSSLAGNYCHCTMCRKSTGGGFAALFDVPKEAIAWTRGEPASFRSSPLATRGFCNKCGSPLYYDKDGTSVRWLTAGSLDDPSIFIPRFHYGVESRVPWADCGRDLPTKELKSGSMANPADQGILD